jgi:hypothetical protein
VFTSWLPLVTTTRGWRERKEGAGLELSEQITMPYALSLSLSLHTLRLSLNDRLFSLSLSLSLSLLSLCKDLGHNRQRKVIRFL